MTAAVVRELSQQREEVHAKRALSTNIWDRIKSHSLHGKALMSTEAAE